MTVRAALVFLLAVGLTGCVTSGDQNPLKTDKGRDEARDAYIQLGLGYLQRGTPSRPRCRCARPSRSTFQRRRARRAGGGIPDRDGAQAGRRGVLQGARQR